jgi:hypothetical protein
MFASTIVDAIRYAVSRREITVGRWNNDLQYYGLLKKKAIAQIFFILASMFCIDLIDAFIFSSNKTMIKLYWIVYK